MVPYTKGRIICDIPFHFSMNVDSILKANKRQKLDEIDDKFYSSGLDTKEQELYDLVDEAEKVGSSLACINATLLMIGA